MQSFIALFTSFFVSISIGATDIPDVLKSRLDSKTEVSEFGEISYRGPKTRNPQGEKVVLLHGVYAGSTHITWRELLPLLDREGLQVYLVDLPGAGENGIEKKRPYSMELFDQFLTHFLEDVVGEPATIISESLLGATALNVAGARPDLVKGLVLLSPTGINTLAGPSPDQEKLFKRFERSKLFANFFYRSVFF